jgi:hypothetical protein
MLSRDTLSHSQAQVAPVRVHEHAVILPQALECELGVQVHRTLKYRADFIGEGIDYSCVHAYNDYRSHPVSAKQNRDNFRKLVRPAPVYR